MDGFLDIGNSPDIAALIKFDSVFGTGAGQAPTDVPVLKSWLVITTGDGTGHVRSQGPYSVHRMMSDWDTTTLHSDLDLGLEHFTPVAFFARDPQGVIVNADSKYRTFKDLIDDAKKQPEAIVCAVTSATGTGRQTLWRIERETGAKFKFVTFKAGSEAVLSVLGGHVPFTTENVSEAWAHIEAKKMRVLAVTTEKRMPALPDTPTMVEAGVPLIRVNWSRVAGAPPTLELPVPLPPEEPVAVSHDEPPAGVAMRPHGPSAPPVGPSRTSPRNRAFSSGAWCASQTGSRGFRSDESALVRRSRSFGSWPCGRDGMPSPNCCSSRPRRARRDARS